MLYYVSDDTNLESCNIAYEFNAGPDDLSWISVMALGGVSAGHTSRLENGYLYSEGVDMNGDVNHPTFTVEKNGENYKITAENIGMSNVYGTYYTAESFTYEGPITWKTVDEWEISYVNGKRINCLNIPAMR